MLGETAAMLMTISHIPINPYSCYICNSFVWLAVRRFFVGQFIYSFLLVSTINSSSVIKQIQEGSITAAIAPSSPYTLLVAHLSEPPRF